MKQQNGSLPRAFATLANDGLKHTLADLFVASARCFADNIAIEDSSMSWSYSELLGRANQFAHYLRERGVQAGDRIALFMPRGPSMYVAMLGIIQAGAAYVPIDPKYPLDRVGYICTDSDAKFVVSEHDLTGGRGQIENALVIDFKRITTDLACRPAAEFTSAVTGATPEDLAYVIYTSGTTGRPKGVMIRNCSICHFVGSEGSILRIRAEDRVLQGFSVAFDMSIEEIWTTLTAGARLIPASAAMMSGGPDLAPQLTKLGITVLHCVPSLLAVQTEAVPSLRLINLGGEACPTDLVKRWHHARLRMVNTYGPTETTVTATFAELSPTEPVTIGKPLPGYQAYVVDDQLNLAPAGCEGELCIGGLAVAAGYINQPELTKEKFVIAPFTTSDGHRPFIYRTGDLVRLNESGNLEFLGRIDTQVKIRGFRVELSEIETVLMQDPDIQLAVVSLLKDHNGHDTLVAFLAAEGGRAIEKDALLSGLRDKLPLYMIPSLLIAVADFPRLASGKVDRKALKFPDNVTTQRRSLVAPTTKTERDLLEVMQSIFGLKEISVNDDFFDELGGHSLKAALTVSRLRGGYGFDQLAVRDIYENPTIHLLAKCVDAQVAGKSAVGNTTASAPEAFQPVDSWRYFLCASAQFLACFFLFGISAVIWLLPFGVYALMSNHGHAFILSLLVAFGAVALKIPLMMAITIAAKWLMIGRYRAGDFPLWGSYYFRWWFMRRLYSLVGANVLCGTPVLNFYLRCLGARIGRGVSLASAPLDAPDLLVISAGSAIGKKTNISNSTVEGGRFKLGTVSLGHGCTIGNSCSIGPDCIVGGRAEIDDLSMLPSGCSVPVGELWQGSPAVMRSRSVGVESAPAVQDYRESTANERPLLVGILLTLGVLVMQVVALAPMMPGLIWLAEEDKLTDGYHFILATPLVSISFVLASCLTCAIFKWLLLGKVRPTRISINSLHYVRYWFVNGLMDISLELSKPLYATLYLPPWYRLLGVKVGRRTEISTASSIAWDQLELADECFIADDVALGVPRIRRGYLEILPTRVGCRTFMGNSALLPNGREIPDGVLIGCLSLPPQENHPHLGSDTSWFGSPAIHLPKRQSAPGFANLTTYKPPLRLYAARLTIEFLRIIAPLTFTLSLGCMIVSVITDLHVDDALSNLQIALVLPILYAVAAVCALLITAGLKHLLIGTYKPTLKPLWCSFVWRSEAITCLYENLAVPFFLDLLRGTPFINWGLRVMGAKIGRRVFTDTTYITEHDMVTVGDDAVLNEDCELQTHLFEDRVMKVSHVKIGPRCVVGMASIILYDTEMQEDSWIGDLSLLMKGEVLPANTRWEGAPASRVKLVSVDSAQPCLSPKIAPQQTALNVPKNIQFVSS